MDRKQSNYTIFTPEIGDFFVGLKRQIDGSYRNARFAYTEVINGVRLLGKITGFNLNPTQTINYTGLTGGNFQPGDIITDVENGNTAVVVSDDGVSSMVISRLTEAVGTGDGFNNGAGVSAAFDGDYYIPEQICEVPEGCIVIDIRIDNASDVVSSAHNIFFSHSENRGGPLIAESGGAQDAIQNLSNPDKFIQGILTKFSPSGGEIKYLLYNNRPDQRIKSTGEIYISVIGEGTDVTCDIYLYGYDA